MIQPLGRVAAENMGSQFPCFVSFSPNGIPQADPRVTELRELVQMAPDLSPSLEDTLLRLARATVRERLKALRGV